MTIPDSITTIGASAFEYCSNLTSISLPFTGEKADGSGATHFGYIFGAERYTHSERLPRSLKTVVITHGTTINAYAFYNCNPLTSITLPEGIATIGENAFYSCQNLTDVYYSCKVADRNNITINSGNTDLLDATWHYAHTYDNVCDTDCNECGETRTAPHEYESVCDRDCDFCGQVRTAPHEYDNDCDAYCNVCGARRRVSDHVYDFACDDECNICSAYRSPAAHEYDHTCDTDCNMCGAERSIEHTYTNACDAGCNVCGYTRTPSDHIYDNACDELCNACGETREVPDHVYSFACDTECNVCGYSRQAAAHVYSDSCDRDCNVCKEKRTAPHSYDNHCDDECGNCGEIRVPADHVYENAFDKSCNECGTIREVKMPLTFGGNSVHEDVSGLAFRFSVAAKGMQTNNFTAIYDNASVDGCKLLSMGAIITNGKESKDVPAVYLCDLKENTADFAVRIVDIPAFAYNRTITATPYIVLEIDGVATTIYGEAQTCSYNDVKG